MDAYLNRATTLSVCTSGNIVKAHQLALLTLKYKENDNLRCHLTDFNEIWYFE